MTLFLSVNARALQGCICCSVAYFDLQFIKILQIKDDFHWVPFSDSAEFCERYVLKCVQSRYLMKFILLDRQHIFQKKAITEIRTITKCTQ